MRVSVTPDNNQLRGLSRQEFPAFSCPADLEAAIERSQNYLLQVQKPEGYWVGELMVDSTLVSDMVAYHHWDGSVDASWERKAVNHIFSMQLPDGGWNIYYGGPAEVNAPQWLIIIHMQFKIVNKFYRRNQLLCAANTA